MLAESWDFRSRAKGCIVSQRTENSVVRLRGYQRLGACGITVVSGSVPGGRKGGRRALRTRRHFGNAPIGGKRGPSPLIDSGDSIGQWLEHRGFRGSPGG